MPQSSSRHQHYLQKRQLYHDPRRYRQWKIKSSNGHSQLDDSRWPIKHQHFWKYRILISKTLDPFLNREKQYYPWIPFWWIKIQKGSLLFITWARHEDSSKRSWNITRWKRNQHIRWSKNKNWICKSPLLW